jgi:CubicO group peptidase (beta-lactamase class C family)
MTDVTGEPFPALMQRLVLDPIGMTNSTFDQPLPAAKRGQEAAAYRADGKMVEGRWHIYPEMAPAGLWTTPTDLLKWAMEITAAKAGKSTKVLTQKAATDMLTVQKEPAGIGPMLHGSGRAFYFEHGGANEGYRAQVMYFPELGQGAAVMTNSDAGGALAQEILYSLAAEYKWPDYAPREIEVIAVDTAALDAYVGIYTTSKPISARLTVARQGTKLFIEEPKFVPRIEMKFTAADKAISPESGLPATFVRKNGKVVSVDLGGITLTR